MSFHLSEFEKANETMAKIKLRLEERLDTLRKNNDASLSADETASIRGRIAEVKAMLAMWENPPIIE